MISFLFFLILQSAQGSEDSALCSARWHSSPLSFSVEKAWAERDQFVAVDKKALNRGFSKGLSWLHFQCSNRSSKSVTQVISFDHPVLDKVDVYENGQLDPKYRLGDQRPHSEMPFEHRLARFPVTLDSGATREFLVRIESVGFHNLAFKQLPISGALFSSFTENLILIYYGLVLAMCLYHLLVYWVLREMVFLHYVMFAFFSLFTHMTVDNAFYKFDTFGPFIQSQIPTLYPFSKIFFMLFAIDFLQLKTRAPREYRICRWVLFVVLGVTGLSLFIPYAWASALSIFLSPLMTLVVFLVAVKLYFKQSFAPALFFIYVGIFVASGNLIFFLSYKGFFENLYFLSHSIEIGASIEFLLLALALAHRTKRSEQEKFSAEMLAQRTLFEAQRLEAVSHMSKRVAHDIRSPLTALEVYSQVYVKDSTPESRLLRTAVQRVKDITNDLSQKTRSGTGERKRYFLVSLIDDIVSELQIKHFGRDDFEIRFRYSKQDCLSAAEVDAKEFKRAISNILNNCFETGVQPLEINIELRTETDKIVISVHDNGPGFDPSLLASLGEQQVTLGKESGSGLGLYSAKKSFSALGAEMRFENPPSGGARVEILLKESSAPENLLTELEVPASGRVAIADNDPSVHLIWKQFLPNLDVSYFLSLDEIVGDFDLYILDNDFGPKAKKGVDWAHSISSGKVIIASNEFESNDLVRKLPTGAKMIAKPYLNGLEIRVRE